MIEISEYTLFNPSSETSVDYETNAQHAWDSRSEVFVDD